MKHQFIFISALLLLFTNCTNEAEISPKDYPFVITEEIIVLKDEGATFSATLKIPTSDKILEHGFIWKKLEVSNPIVDDYKILFEKDIKEGTFSYKITSGFENNETYSVRAYIKTEKHEVYGNRQSFVSQGTLPIRILEFVPKGGYSGQQVVVKVDNISGVKENIVVKFGDIVAPIDSISAHNIYVKSPLIPENTDIHISVKDLENRTTSDQTYKVSYAWSQINDFPGKARAGSISLSTDQKGYLIGGVDLPTNSVIKNFTRVFYEFDPNTNSWNRNRDLPFTPYFRNAGFAINNHLYVYSFNENAFYIYNSERDDWTLETHYPGHAEDHLVTFVINGEAFVGSSWNKSFFKYSAESKKWTEISPFPGTERFRAISYTFQGKGFVGLGIHFNNNVNDFWSYDPANDTWSFSSNFPGEQRSNAISFMYNNKMYVGLGVHDLDEETFKDIWEFQESSYQWIKKDDYGGQGSLNSSSFSINGKAFVGIGSSLSRGDEAYQKDFWEFNLIPEN